MWELSIPPKPQELATVHLDFFPRASKPYISEVWSKDKLIIKSLILKDITILDLAHPNLRDDDQFMHSCIQINGLAIKYASSRIQSNVNHALLAIKQNYFAYSFISDDIKYNLDIIMIMGQLDPNSTVYCHSCPTDMIADYKKAKTGLTQDSVKFINMYCLQKSYIARRSRIVRLIDREENIYMFIHIIHAAAINSKTIFNDICTKCKITCGFLTRKYACYLMAPLTHENCILAKYFIRPILRQDLLDLRRPYEDSDTIAIIEEANPSISHYICEYIWLEIFKFLCH